MRLPDNSQHLAVVGANGTGKTVAALWHLSQRDYDKRPWLIYNWKRERDINSIPHAQFIELDEVPVRAGIYIVRPAPHQTDEIEAQMWEIWRRGGIGVVVDEGYMVGPNNPAFRAILTQGRSLEIPTITLSQRPVWMDRFVFSEATFYQIFRLNHAKDVKNVQEFIPHNIKQRLPEFHSYYYDVKADNISVLTPVPQMDVIHATFESRLKHLRKIA